MSRKIIKAVTLRGGRVGLSAETESAIKRRVGSDNLVSVKPATQSQVDWVRAMGGIVPDGRVAKGA
jgi:hypothetical protein